MSQEGQKLSEKKRPEEILRDLGVFRTADAVNSGISQPTVSRLAMKGILVRLEQSLRRLLWIVCSSAPFSPNIDGLSRDLGLAKESVYTYLECLGKSGLLKSYRAFITGGKIARKSAKIYPANANMLTAIVSQASLKQEMGMVRETFLQSSLSETHVSR